MMMNMWTSSSGTAYSHPLVHVENPEVRIDYGWYAHVLHDCLVKNLVIKEVRVVKFETKAMENSNKSSVQSAYFVSRLKELDPKTYPLINSMCQDHAATSNV